MRYLSIMLVLAFFATMLEASYYRSIRVIAYPKKSSAQKAAKELKAFIATKQNLGEFQDTIGFNVGVVKAGKYYMVVMEPFKDEVKELQETLDVLRLKYKKPYVKKIKGKSSLVKKSKSKKVVATKKTESKQQVVTPVVVKKVESKEVVPQVTLMVAEPMVEVVEMQKVVVTNKETSKESNKTLAIKTKETPQDTIATSVLEEKIVTDKNSSATQALEKNLNNKIYNEINSTAENNGTTKAEVKTVVVQKVITTQKNSTPQAEVERVSEEDANLLDMLAPLYENIVILWQALFAITLLTLIVIYKKYTTSQNRNDELLEEDTKKIEQLSREMKNRDRYIAHVNRELSSPIESILELSDELRESECSSKSKSNIQKLESSAQSLSLLFQDISDLKVLQEKRLELNESEFNINDILKNVLYITAIDAKKNNIALSIDVDKNVPSHLVGDAQRIEHILRNILSSAIKRTRAGNLSLKLLHSIDDDDIITLSFSVEDSGKVMTQDAVENAFKLYHEPTEEESSLSTSLGLYISKELIELMNGEISIDSEGSRGTTVSFFIKVDVNDAQERRHYRVPSEEYLGKNVLLVESSERNLTALKHAFEYFNYNVFSIASFEESTELEDTLVDLLVVNQHKLTDVAFQSIEDIQKNSHCKLLVLGDIYTPIDPEAIDKFKIDAVLTTPLIQQDVFDTLKNICAKASMYSLYVQKLEENRVKADEKQVESVVADIEITKESVDTSKEEEEPKREITEEILDSEEILQEREVIQEAIEPLAVEVGIANCDDDEELYDSMLQDFQNSYENSSNLLEALCEANDFEKARYYAMDIKDLAINIGAYELSESVAALEYEFEKSEKKDWMNYISLYAQSLDKVLAEIDNRLH